MSYSLLSNFFSAEAASATQQKKPIFKDAPVTQLPQVANVPVQPVEAEPVIEKPIEQPSFATQLPSLNITDTMVEAPAQESPAIESLNLPELPLPTIPTTPGDKEEKTVSKQEPPAVPHGDIEDLFA